ncbi:MAG: cell division protein [Caulobacteraceae bacterium]|jgi:cell division protein FtsL
MLAGVFNRRYRGFRVIDLVALAILLVLALTSYAFKTLAEGMGADTAGVEAQIADEESRIHLLRAEIAHLDDPGRIERLSKQYLGLQAADPKQETTADALPQVALRGQATTPAKGVKP